MGAALAVAGAGCAPEGGGATNHTTDSQRWEEFRATHLLGETPGGAAFLLDDMVFGEADLRAAFQRRSAQGSNDGGTAALGVGSEELIVETPYGVISSRGAPTIDYCFAAPSSWGQVNGNLVDGFYTAPPLAAVAANIGAQ